MITQITNRLWVKTNYSLLESGIALDDYINIAIKNNWKWLSICDEKTTFAYFKFWKKCLENNIKPIFCLSFTFKEDEYLILAKNNEGLKTLFYCSSVINTNDEQKYNDIFNILNTSKNIVLFSKNLQNNFNDYKLNKNTYLNKNQYRTFLILKAIKNDEKIDYKNFEHIVENMKIKYCNNIDIENIIHSCRYDHKEFIEVNQINQNINNELENKAFAGLRQRFKNTKVPNIYIKRLNYELDIIKKANFSNYILKVCDYTQFAKKNQIFVGPGRGSAAGSLLCYSLFITSVDPIKYNLLFERFLNIYRKEKPDIDIDFEDKKRYEIIDYISKKYSINHVAKIITFQKFGLKNAIKFLLKSTKEFDNDYISNHVKQIFIVDNLLSAMSYQETKSINYTKLINTKLAKKYQSSSYPNHSAWRFVLKNAKYIHLFPKNFNIHASGLIISNNNLNRCLGTIQSNYANIAQKDMFDLHNMNYIKYDILGLSNLSLIRDCIKLIQKERNIKLHIHKINLSDKNTYDFLVKEPLLGIFQLESRGMSELVKKLSPTNIEEIAACISLFRPGSSKFINLYLKNKNNQQNITYQSIYLKEFTSETYGVIIYQEQIMKLVHKLANFSLEKADIFRIAISKKQYSVLAKMKGDFISGCVSNNISSSSASSLFDIIQNFGNYGFNKSHAISYSYIVYWTAYLKANFLLEFSAIYLSNIVFMKKETENYLNYLKKKKIKTFGPVFDKSCHKYIIRNKSLYLPFEYICGIGYDLSETIISIRKEHEINNYKEAFFYLCQKISKKQMILLLENNIFDCYKLDKVKIINKLDNIYMWAKLGLISQELII